MYNKSLIIDIKKKEKKISLLSVEKHKNELDYKNKELTMKVLYLSSLKEVNKSILAELKSNRHNLTQPEDYNLLKLTRTLEKSLQESKIWEEFNDRFKEANSFFYTTLIANHPNLSAVEVRVACLLQKKHNTKEIAEILQRSPKTIENIRGLIRIKINLHKDANLTSFLLSM